MKQQTNKWLTIIIIVAVVASFFVAMTRIDAESNHRTIQVAIRYDDVIEISESVNQSVSKVLEVFRELGVTTLMVREKENLYQTLGVGFDVAVLDEAATIGYVISPEIKLFDRETPEQIQQLVDEIRKIPNLNTIYFEDKEIPGYTHPEMIHLISDYGIGFTEFYSGTQKGFSTLVREAEKNSTIYPVIRMFTDEKVENISTPDRVIRYELALTERGIRVFTFVLEEDKAFDISYNDLMGDIEDFVQRAEEKGYVRGIAGGKYEQSHSSPILLFLIGLGTISVAIKIGTLIIGEKLSILIGILLVGCYITGLFINEHLARQGMAFLTALIFPIYSIITMVDVIEMNQYGKAIKQLLKVCLLTLVGALILTGVLSTPSYMQGIDGFRGVKLAHIIPIIGVMVLFVYKHSTFIIKEIKALFALKIKYKSIMIMLFVISIVTIGGIYITRTGNGEISELEQIVRMGLDQLLGIRPRTKEFLIGHPLLLLVLYFGVKGLYLPALILGVIGQVSMMNTFAHIHTPLVVSMIRSVYGIVIGIVIGVVLIEIVKFIVKVINKWIIKQE